MDPNITFEFEGCHYTVEFKAYDLSRIILPDGRMLEPEAWLESYPPKPQGLHVSRTFRNMKPEKIAILMDAVVAKTDPSG
jgi:hypothetical protein